MVSGLPELHRDDFQRPLYQRSLRVRLCSNSPCTLTVHGTDEGLHSFGQCFKADFGRYFQLSSLCVAAHAALRTLCMNVVHVICDFVWFFNAVPKSCGFKVTFSPRGRAKLYRHFSSALY